MDVSAILSHMEDRDEVKDEEKLAMQSATLLVATTASALMKQFNVYAGITECFIGDDALLTIYHRNWRTFVKDNEDEFAGACIMNPDLPARIQCLILQQSPTITATKHASKSPTMPC